MIRDVILGVIALCRRILERYLPSAKDSHLEIIRIGSVPRDAPDRITLNFVEC
jgi:hypothetical protein